SWCLVSAGRGQRALAWRITGLGTSLPRLFRCPGRWHHAIESAPDASDHFSRRIHVFLVGIPRQLCASLPRNARKRKPGREGSGGDDRGVFAWDADEGSPQIEPLEVLFGRCPKKESEVRGFKSVHEPPQTFA